MATRLLSGTHARGLTNVAAFCRYARYFIPTFCNIVYIARLFRLTRAWLAQSSHRWLWWTTDCKSCCMRNEAVGSTGVLCKRILRVFSTRASRKSRILSSPGVLSTSKLVQWRNYVWNCAVVPESTGSCRRSAWWTSPPLCSDQSSAGTVRETVCRRRPGLCGRRTHHLEQPAGQRDICPICVNLPSAFKTFLFQASFPDITIDPR